MQTAILWFRQDLRLDDHPALQAALQDAERLLPVYIDTAEESAPWPAGGASRWWLHHSLKALDQQLRQRGSRLIIRRGASAEVLRELAQASGAEQVFWSRLYEPAHRARDQAVQTALTEHGIRCRIYSGGLLCEPGALQNGSGQPYRVFTPFYKAFQARIDPGQPARAPAALPPVAKRHHSLALDELQLLPDIPWDREFYDHWQPGADAARTRLTDYSEQRLADYPAQRDLPAQPGTSRLSPHLHFGELSPRQVLAHLRAAAQAPQGPPHLEDAAAALARQVVWREFSYHILYHFPHVDQRALNPRFDKFPWRSQHEDLLQAWQNGATGIPIVDAGLRELWHTGWMHNRVRMICGSFLCKHCRIPWQSGARWFWDTLVDADLANNSFGWQWVAGSGADAAPYFRVFNPVRQSEKFDPQGRYLRRWLPALTAVDDKWIHQPWTMSAAEQSRCGVHIGRDYPAPILDLATERAAALEAYQRLRTHGA